MRLARTLHLLPIHAPHPPDRYLCSPSYGTAISDFDCQLVVDTYWPSGKTPVHYYFTQQAPSNGIALPFISSSAARDTSCQVAIEPAGPRHRYPKYLSFSPEMMRGLAGYIIQKCAVEAGGIGGFVTVGLEAAEQYLEGWVDSRDEKGAKNSSSNASPPNGAYLTISINGMNRTRFAPGDTDPDIAGYLSKYATMSSQLYNEQLIAWRAMARFLRDRTMVMIRGAPSGAARFWWDGAGLDYYTGLASLLPSPQGRNRQGSLPDSGKSDGTNFGGPWRNAGAGNDEQQQPQGGAGNGDGNGDGSEDDQDEVAAEGDGEMAYLCDNSAPASPTPVSKGATAPPVGPDPIDCDKLSWSGLPGSSNPTSLLTLENPSLSTTSNNSIGKPHLFTFGTCTLAVFATNQQPAPPPSTSLQPSAARPSVLASGSTANGVTTISWTHILAAFETLTNFCVANPLYPKRSRGGVAYWSQQGQGVESWINGKRRRRVFRERRIGGEAGRGDQSRENEEKELKIVGASGKGEETGVRWSRRDGVDGVDGAMALPRGVNVTVFRTGSGTVPVELEGELQCKSDDGGGQGQGRNNASACAGGGRR